jgi:hypothetical protein
MPFLHAGEGQQSQDSAEQSVLQQAEGDALAATAQARQPQCCSRVP